MVSFTNFYAVNPSQADARCCRHFPQGRSAPCLELEMTFVEALWLILARQSDDERNGSWIDDTA